MEQQLTHGSLFSGIGGFDLAAEWMGWQNVFHCEWNEFGQKILNHYWPNATSYTDITKTDFSIHRGNIDVLTGGFPCQPYSSAGKRLGKEDDRHLWPEMLRAIREIQPQWVVGENVRGLLNWNGGLVFHEVQTELEAEGYEVLPFLLPAAGVNAPHERYRIWFIAYANRGANLRTSGQDEGTGSEERVQQRNAIREPFVADGFREFSSDTNRQHRRSRAAGENRAQACNSCAGNDAYTCNPGLQGCKKFGSTSGGWSFRNQQPAGLLPSDWQKFPTEPPLCSGDDGLPTELDGITFPKWRNESIKAGGNAIVPQVAYQIFQAIKQISNAA